MPREIDAFRHRFAHEFARLLRTLEGLDEEAANWRPSAPARTRSWSW
jgi:hypothetical protein